MQVVLLAVIALQLLLPPELIALPQYVLPGLELLCLIALQIVTPKKAVFESRVRRFVVLALIALIVVANMSSLQLLLQALFVAGKAQAPGLLVGAVNVYLTNVAIFGLLYWEMDSGGPGVRRNPHTEPDFLFPQQNLTTELKPRWYPTFIDYLYISITNATAFSPTDTLPLTRRAKLIMAAQAILSLLVVVLITARAINIL